MPKNNSKQIDYDYIKNINKITFIGLTCMAALGTSMIFMECDVSKASPLSKSFRLLRPLSSSTLISKFPAYRPTIKSNPKFLATKLPLIKKPVTQGTLLSSINKNYLTPIKPLNPIKPVLTLKTRK